MARMRDFLKEQIDIPKFESGNGNSNPSLLTLHRLVTGVGVKLKVEF